MISLLVRRRLSNLKKAEDRERKNLITAIYKAHSAKTAQTGVPSDTTLSLGWENAAPRFWILQPEERNLGRPPAQSVEHCS
jgi:hypothetical protein